MTPPKVDPAIFTVEYSKAVLESLVEQGGKVIEQISFQTNSISVLNPFPFLKNTALQILPCVPALVEVAKAALGEYESYLGRDDDESHEFTQGMEHEIARFLIAQAKAVAPRMLEAGMTLPEAPK